MTPARPQQMSGQTDDADDLIAELAKLMATDARGNDTARLDAATEPRPASQPPIRIPGMGQPTAAAPSAANKFDFGRPPAPAAVPPPEPLANWQERAAPRAAAPSQAPMALQEPFVAAPAPTAPSPANAPSADAGGRAFDFDFGFNAERPTAAGQAPAAAPVPPAPTPSILSAGHDPIADLIAAELDAAGPLRTTVAPPVAAPAPAAAFAPRPMTPLAAPQPQAEPALEAPAPAVQLRALPPISAPAAPSQAAPRPQPSAPALRPVNLTARPLPSENDRFATAPVFGLGGRPSSEPAAPKAAPDPMDEIENLIGEAVRVELAAPQQLQPVRAVQAPPAARVAAPVQPQASSGPSVPPLTTQFAPRRTSLRDPEPASRGAEDAILAAAAATGAEVGHIDTPQAEQRAFKPKKQARRERPALEDRQSGGAFKQLIVPAVAGTLLLAAGFGLYWVLGMSHHDGQAPILTADATPAKQIPPKSAASDATHSVVLDQLSGKAPAAGTEQLVSRDQTAGADAAQVVAAAPAATTTNNDTGIANRKVRTVTVRPDGTIVSGDDAVAGAAKLPVDRPNVPAVPGAAVAGTNDGTTPTADTSASATDSSSAPALPPLTPATADALVPTVADTPTNPPAADAPIPMTRPASLDPTFATAQPSSPVNALVRGNANKPVDLIGNLAANADASPATAVPVQPTANAQVQAPAATVADTADVTAAPAHAQLASQRSQADAQASASSLQRKFGSVLNNAKLQVVKVDLGTKGIYYRVIMPASSLQSAQQICTSIKAGGGDCVALNG
jgi:hypothetical protein